MSQQDLAGHRVATNPPCPQPQQLGSSWSPASTCGVLIKPSSLAEGFQSWMWRGLTFLLPFLFFGHVSVH